MKPYEADHSMSRTVRKRGIPAIITRAIALFFLVAVAPHALHAEESATPPPSENDSAATSEGGFVEGTFSLIGTTFEALEHDYLSTSVENLSQRIDSFFGDEQLYQEYDRSYMSLRLTTDYGRGGESDAEIKLRLHLKLPNTKNRLSLNIESDDDDFESEELAPGPTTGHTIGENDINASLQYMLRETRHWEITLSPGCKLHLPLDPFARLRFKRYGHLFDWKSIFVQSFEWFESSGYGSKTSYTLQRPLNDRTLLRITTQAYRNEDEYVHNDFRLSERVTLYYAYKPRIGLSTEVAFFARTEPNWQHETYLYNVALRRDIYKGFVFFDIKPQITFEKVDNFHGNPSIMLQLEVLYGVSYLTK